MYRLSQAHQTPLFLRLLDAVPVKQHASQDERERTVPPTHPTHDATSPHELSAHGNTPALSLERYVCLRDLSVRQTSTWQCLLCRTLHD